MIQSIYVIRGPRGASYVGCTETSLHARLVAHVAAAHRGAPWPLAQAIREHGADKFKIRLVAQSTDARSAWDTERTVMLQLLEGGVALYNADPYLRRELATGERSSLVERWTKRMIRRDELSEAARAALRMRQAS